MGRDINLNILGIPPIIILFAVIAYFVYGNSTSAALAVLLLGFLWSIALVSAAIPFIGVVVYWFIADWIKSWVFSLASISTSWIIDLMWWIYIIFALIVTLMSTYLIISKYSRRECRVINGVKICRYK